MDAPPTYRVVDAGKPGWCVHRMRRRVTATADGVVVRCECVRCGFATEAVYRAANDGGQAKRDAA